MYTLKINKSIIKYNINLDKSINSKERKSSRFLLKVKTNQKPVNTRKVRRILWAFQVFQIL